MIEQPLRTFALRLAISFALTLLVACVATLVLPSTSRQFEALVTFPEKPASSEEPLLVTGRTYAADFLTVRYLPDGKLQFAWNSFGNGGLASAPLDVQRNKQLRIRIDAPSLYERFERRLTSDNDRLLIIELDGRTVLKQEVHFFRASRLNTYVGKNPFGSPAGLGGAPAFSGTLTPKPGHALPLSSVHLGWKLLFTLSSQAWLGCGLVWVLFLVLDFRGAQKGKPRCGADIRLLVSLGLLSTAAITFIGSAGQPFALGHKNKGGYPEFYTLMTESFAAGQLEVLTKPSPELLALPNPYDPKANAPYRLHDAILYQGKYYLYYSPVPALLLNQPVLWATGTAVPQASAVTLFAALGMWASLGALWVVKRAFFPNAPLWAVLFLGLALAFMSSVLHVVGRPMVYEQAIACAYMLLMFGGLGLALALAKPGIWLRWGLVSAACFALAIACRPNLTIICPFLGLAFLFLVNRKSSEASVSLLSRPDGKQVFLFLLLCLPFVAIGGALAWLNWTRFGSPTDFGWKWQLWGWKKPAYEAVFFSWQNLATDFQLYFATPPKWLGSFPYVGANVFKTLCRSPYNTGAEPLLGLMWSMPVPILCSLWWSTHGGLSSPRGCTARQIWFFCLGGAGLSALGFDLFYSSVAMRYMLDFAPLLLLASCAAVLHFSSSSRWFSSLPARIGLMSMGLGIALLGIALGLTSYGRFQSSNPDLFSLLSSFFP